MSLKQKITDDMKAAMRAKDKRLLGAIRLITAAIKQVEVDQRIDSLNDQQVIEILTKMIKQRRDSISQYEKAGRANLVEQEQFEIDHIKTYLPEALSEDEIKALIEEAITASGAATIRDMGKVMGLVKPKLQGRADMGNVSKIIKEKLSS